MLAVALALRLWGIGWQLPAALYFDELKYVEWAGAATRGDERDVDDLRNPSFFHHLLHAEYEVAARLRPGPSQPGAASTRETAVFQLWLARLTSATLGAFACMLAGLAAAALVRGLPDPTGRATHAALAGCAAGLILAVAPLHVHLAHYALNDAPASFFLAATLLSGTRLLVSRRPRDVLLAGLVAGIFAGLAFSTKYNFAIGLVLPMTAALLHPWARRAPDSAPHASAPAPASGYGGARTDDRPPLSRQGRGGSLSRDVALPAVQRLLVVLGGFVVGAVAGMPELVSAPGDVAAGIAEQARLGGIRWNGQSDAPVWQLYAETLLHGLGWPVLVGAALGAALLGRRSPAALVATLAVPVVALAVMLRQELFFARFALPLLPSLAILAGIGIVGLAAAIAQGRGVRARFSASALAVSLTFGLLLLAALPALVTTIRHNQLATIPDTRVLAWSWLREHAGGARAAAELYGTPINWAGSSSPRGFKLLRVGTFVEPAMLGRAACEDARYFVVSSLTAERETARLEGRLGARPAETGYDVLAREGRVVATFDPFQPGQWMPAHPDNTGIPFWGLERYARPGPRVTIYDVPEPSRLCRQQSRR